MIQSKPSEKGEIITYLSRMGDVLDDIQERSKIIVLLIGAVHTAVHGDETDIMFGEKHFRVKTDFQIVSSDTAHIFLCQVGTKKILRIYKPFIGGQPPVNGLHVN